MDQDSLNEKIKKLLALSDSSNPNEAAIALQRAQKLMEKYKIKADDLNLDSNICEILIKRSSLFKARMEQSYIMSIIATTFGIKFIFNENSDIIVIGPKEILPSCEYVYTLLTRHLAAALKNFQKDIYITTLEQFARESAITDYCKTFIPAFYEDFLNLESSVCRLNVFYRLDEETRKRDIGDFNNAIKKSLELLNKNIPKYGPVIKLLKKVLNQKRRNFAQGFLLGVLNNIPAFKHDDSEIEQLNKYTQKHYPNLIKKMPRSSKNSTFAQGCFDDGLEEGKKASINQAIHDKSIKKQELSFNG